MDIQIFPGTVSTAHQVCFKEWASTAGSFVLFYCIIHDSFTEHGEKKWQVAFIVHIILYHVFPHFPIFALPSATLPAPTETFSFPVRSILFSNFHLRVLAKDASLSTLFKARSRTLPYKYCHHILCSYLRFMFLYQPRLFLVFMVPVAQWVPIEMFMSFPLEVKIDSILYLYKWYFLICILLHYPTLHLTANCSTAFFFYF